MTSPSGTKRKRTPAYSSVVKALWLALEELADGGHDGILTMATKKCRKCMVIREDIRPIYDAAIHKPKKARRK